MIVKKVLLFVGFLAALLMPALSARAYDTPRIYIKELNLNQTSFKSGGAIDGDFLMWNTADAIVTDLTYNISLIKDRAVFGEETFFVSDQIYPDKTLPQEFSYHIPQNIPGGIYKLKVQLFSKSGMSLNWIEKDMDIKSANKYLSISASLVAQGESNYPPLMGAGFEINETPKIKFTASNPFSEKIEFKPAVSVYRFQSNMEELDKFFGETQELNPGKSKEIEIPMPKYQKPGSYLAKVVLSSNNADISNAEKFRWVLKGEGARILNVKTNNDLLKSGEEAKITVEFAGPADAMNIGKGTLIINVFNGDGKNSFSQEKTVQLSDDIFTEIFSFIPASDIANPRMEAKIIKNGKELDSYTAQIKTPGVDLSSGEKENSSAKNKNSFLAAIILIVLLIIIFIMAKVFLGKKKLFLFAILIGAGFLFSEAGEIQAASLVTSWNAPVQDAVYNYGNPITFNGEMSMGVCSNYVDYTAEVSVCDVQKANCVSIGDEYYFNVSTEDFSYDSANKKFYIIDNEGFRVVKVDETSKQIEKMWGSRGSGRGQFDDSRGIFYDSSSGLIYVADTNNDRIVRFDSNSTILLSDPTSSWEEFNEAGDSLNSPAGVFFKSPFVYVADTNNNRIVRFKPNSFAGTWESFSGPVGDSLNSPAGVFFKSPFVYAADTNNNRIARFKWSNGFGSAPKAWESFTTSSSGDTFNSPRGVSYSSGMAYVADSGNNRIVRFDPDNNPPSVWQAFGSAGSGAEQFDDPFRVTEDSGSVFVADSDNKRIVKFQLTAGGALISGTWDVFDFFMEAYNIISNIPSALSLPGGFTLADGVTDYDGDGSPEPLGAVYAKVKIDAFNNSTGIIKTVNAFERIIIQSLPASQPPVVSNLNISPLDYCKKYPGDIMLAWRFQDAEDSDIQTAYQLKITRSDFREYDSGKVTGALGKNTSIFAAAINSESKCSPVPGCAGFINYGNYNYTWSVKVWDSGNLTDGPKSGAGFSVPSHSYPKVGFAPPPPSNFIVNAPIDFQVSGNADNQDNSQCYPAGDNTDCKQWIWDFDYDGATFTNDKVIDGANGNWTHAYSLPNSSYKVVLQIKDNDGYICSNSDSPETLGAAIPKWKEVIPR